MYPDIVIQGLVRLMICTIINILLQIFRETKEKEIQNLLRGKRDLESKLSKVAPELLPDNSR